MFYYIRGKLVLLEQNSAAIDAGGVAYRMSISHSTYEALPKSGLYSDPPEVTLYTYLSVREDGMELFGFASEEELSSFKLLLGVSGVGPKVALSILSLLSPQKFAQAVCTEDKKTISQANGVGPKTAARIILELKDKLAAFIFTSDKDTHGSNAPRSGSSASNPSKFSEAADALAVLGYTHSECIKALNDIDIDNLSLEDIIRSALKKLVK